MKKRVMNLTLFLCFLTIGCDNVNEETYGLFFFLLNGEPQSGGPGPESGTTLTYNGSDRYFLSIELSPTASGVNRGMYFAIPSIKPGSYPIQPKYINGTYYASGFSESYEDQPVGRYESVSSSDSIYIDKFNVDTGSIEARFEGTYVVDRADGIGRTLPDTLRITQGFLSATLHK